MKIGVTKPRTDKVVLRFDDVEVVMDTQEFHHLITILKQFNAKKWDKDSLILVSQELCK